MRENVYKNKASSIESQILTVPPNAWQLLAANAANENNAAGSQAGQGTSAGNETRGENRSGGNASGSDSRNDSPRNEARGDAKSGSGNDAKNEAKNDTKNDVKSDAKNESKSDGRSAQRTDGRFERNGVFRPPFFFIPDSSMAYIDLKGNFAVLSNGPGNIAPLQLDEAEYESLLDTRKKKHYFVINAEGEEQLLVLQLVGTGPRQTIGVVQVSTPTAPLRELILRQQLTFIFLSLVALLIGLLGFLPVIRKTLIPLSNMVKTVEQINSGNLATRLPESQGQMEIDRLSESFNGMLMRLEESFEAEKETKEQMRQFIADASHELRTPLTSIRGFLEVLLRGAAGNPDQLRKALTSMHGESERLNKLVHDLLVLAKLDKTPHTQLTDGMLDSVIREMEPQLRILAGSRQLTLRVEPNTSCNFEADKMKQVILNLFHNAVQHTDPDKGHIEISLTGYPHGIELEIKDNGPGISEQHLPHVFDRFYRSDSSRTRKYGGAGLGLSITKSIVELHGGSVEVESREGEGCIFTVRLPRP
ncbi:HAMP domain-containing histidine kinase [Paenibacillus piri]|uniref:histidine kinase n=2 Tax=Paenibacillus piri TaxID=2547395 RepID=A0A4R5KZB7_9BACL|nr:HAMP domain-containing histidine kinase [Paenibacillus piri]